MRLNTSNALKTGIELVREQFPALQRRKLDEVPHEAHAAMADFLNAARLEEIVVGNNMTTLTLHISRSRARNLQAGDPILMTRLDHDANIAPWMLAAEDLEPNSKKGDGL